MIALRKNLFLLLNNGNHMLQRVKITTSAAIVKKTYILAVVVFLLLTYTESNRAAVASDNHSVQDLEYGVVLFEYYKQDYFSALIEQEYAQAINNSLAKSQSGQVLKGGMMLSYGMSDEAKKIFDSLLDTNSSLEVRNRAWYYMASMFYKKSDLISARQSLAKVSGVMPKDLYTEHQYLAALLKEKDKQEGMGENPAKNAQKDTPYYPYLLFNLAVLQVKANQTDLGAKHLEEVTGFAGVNEELSVLADRARHALTEIAIKRGQLPMAWAYLKQIRTTGLYSNRALLAYAWAAIKLKQFNDAIPALEMLSGRSIAIPEVQEAKVLLAHVYEQERALKKALKSNIAAEKEFKQGVEMITEARKAIDKQDVPIEFIQNLKVLMDDSDWYGSQPSLDYKKLTPFLIDLMASLPFHETLRELADLYAIRENLNYWLLQADEHLLILDSADKKTFDESIKNSIQRSLVLKDQFNEKREELKLNILLLPERDQERLEAMIESTTSELKQFDSRIDKLKKYKKPYEQPKSYRQFVVDKHEEIKSKLKETEKYIVGFEKIMRGLVRVELNKHEERMQYYSAQSRLAKARLYDMTLLSLEKEESATQSESAKPGVVK